MIVMKVLLILLYFGTVNGCLVVRPVTPENPNLGKCKCSVNLFNQDDILKNEGGKYLGNQKVWDPIVSSTDDCTLSISCNAISGVSSFFTVLFRSNGSPHFINRVIGNKPVDHNQPRSIDNMICSEDSDGSWQWFYYGSPIYDFSLSCIADEDSCSCPKISFHIGNITNRAPDVPSQCQYISTACPRGDEIPFLFATNQYPVHSGSALSSELTIYEDLVCLKEEKGTFDWYFSNLKLPGISIWCNTNEVAYTGEIQNVCGTFKLSYSHDDLMFYHRKGEYEYAERGVLNYEVLDKDIHISCGNEFTPVIFSQNMDPIPMTSVESTIKCVLNPLNDYLHMWIANGTRVISPAGGCIKIKKLLEIKMNGCVCPPLKYIEPMDIIDMDSHSSYLASRITTRLPVFVSDLCEVSFDASLMNGLDFNLMLFRDEAPAIFMRRLVANASHPNEVFLPDLSCRIIGENNRWDYGASIITDKTLYVAFQVNEPECSCADFTVHDSVTMTKLDGTCDILRFQCKNDEEGVEISYKPFYGPSSNYPNQQIIRGWTNDLTVVGAVCINSVWYINGVEVANPEASCTSFSGYLDYLPFTENCPCSAPEVFETPSEENHKAFWNRFRYYYPGSDSYMNRTANLGNINFINNECRSEYTCSGDDTFVVFGINQYPMVYPSGQKPEMRCYPPPVAENRETERYWFIDNVMINMPVFACFPRIQEIDDPEIKMNGCKCPQIRYIDQNGITELGSYSQYLSSKRTLKPIVTVSQKCEISVDESDLDVGSHQIMLFRNGAPPLSMLHFQSKNNSVPIRLYYLYCSQKGGKYHWEYLDYELSDDVIYITVQEDIPTCTCKPMTVSSDVLITNLTCDTFHVSCNQPNRYLGLTSLVDEPDLYETNVTLNWRLMESTEIYFTGTSCIDEQWYFNGIPIISPSFYCRTHFEDDDFDDFSASCPCPFPSHFSADSWNAMKDRTYSFNKNRRFSDRMASNGIMVYDKDGCTVDYVCENNDDLVVFSNEMEPVVYGLGEHPKFQCVTPPVAQNQPAETYWWIDNTMVSLVHFVCFPKIDESPIDMNGCQCPQLRHIDQYGISNNPESAYLNNRATFEPKVTVTESCEVTVDVSSMEINNFYLMLFRDHEPPVFAHKFYTPSDINIPFTFSDLTCQKVEDTYQWNYKNFKLTDQNLYIALQSNEESCGCEDFQLGDDKITMTKLDEQCDIMKFTCSNTRGPRILNNRVQVSQGFSNELTLTTATCVNNQWELNGVSLTSPIALCSAYLEDNGGEYQDFLDNCKCEPMGMLTSTPEPETEFWKAINDNYDKNVDFLYKQVTTGQFSYLIGDCTAKYSCPNQDVVVFSLNRSPMIYPSGETPHIGCISASTYPNGERYYWVDNSLLHAPFVACYPKD